MHNIAIVGYRMQGSQHHAPAFDRLPDCRIVGICDVVPERAQEGAEKYGVTAYTNIDEMLDQEDVDIVNIPTGEQFRYDLVMNALKRGKHVFTEKPLAGAEGQYKIGPGDVKLAREMIDAWQEQGVSFGVCFGLHASRNVRRAMDVIRSGELGALKQVHARCFQGTWNHLIDMVRYLCGEVAGVFGYAGDDESANKMAGLQFENGAIGSVAMSANLNVQFQIKWIGELGEITIDDINGSATWHHHKSQDAIAWSQDRDLRRGTYGSLFEELIEDFVGSIEEQRAFEADGWAGLRHMEIEAAITEAIHTGKAVKVERYRPEMGETLGAMSS